jgi:predicted O-methyltransferase YrrM
MYEGEQRWRDVDRYFIDHLVVEDDALAHARRSSGHTAMPGADVAPNQGAFLSVIAQIARARRVLEFGTLAGYSTIWFARAVGTAAGWSPWSSTRTPLRWPGTISHAQE